MKRLLLVAVAVGLLVSVPIEAKQGGHCNPEGTWYGYNSGGALWIVTISRSGPSSYTTLMDNGANVMLPGAETSTDWRGELVKAGHHRYHWTTMAYMRTVEGFPVPFVLGFCPLTAEFSGCDAFQGAGVCDFYGLLAFDQDPFEDGLFIQSGEPFEAFFRRMPIEFPVP